MAPLHSGLYKATNVNWHHCVPKTGLENPLGIQFPGDPCSPFSSNSLTEKFGYKGAPSRVANEEQKYFEVRIHKATKILGATNFKLNAYCVTAHYPGESAEFVEARKKSFVPGKKTAPGSCHEDCFSSETIFIPYNARQQLLFVDVFQVPDPSQFELEGELIGRATLPLADPTLEQPSEWQLVRGRFDFGGTVTVSVKLAAPEGKVRPLPDLRDFPPPVSPRQFDEGGIDMSPFDIPREGSSSKSSGQGGINMCVFDEPRKWSGSRSTEGAGSSPRWVPVLSGGLGLDSKMDDVRTFEGVKHGTMSPFPTFAPDWFGAKLPLGTPPLRPLPDPAAFHPSQLRLGELIAQIPEVATVAPAVAAMVAQAIRAAPLLTPTMAPPAMPTFSSPTFVAPAVAPPMWTVAPSYGGKPNARFYQ